MERSTFYATTTTPVTVCIGAMRIQGTLCPGVDQTGSRNTMVWGSPLASSWCSCSCSSGTSPVRCVVALPWRWKRLCNPYWVASFHTVPFHAAWGHVLLGLGNLMGATSPLHVATTKACYLLLPHKSTMIDTSWRYYVK